MNLKEEFLDHYLENLDLLDRNYDEQEMIILEEKEKYNYLHQEEDDPNF